MTETRGPSVCTFL